MKQPKILHIPQWYPNPDDIQLGTFIQKQILATSASCENIVLSIVGSKNATDVSISVNKKDALTEIQVIYCAKGNAFKRLKHYLKALQKGLNAVADINFYPDLIHCHVAGKNLWVAEKYFKDTPVILSEHWSGYLDGRFDAISSFKRKKRIKRINNCKEILVVSEHLKQAVQSKGITSPISIIDNIIETKTIRKQLEKESFTLLVVADLADKTKNISGVIRAFSKIAKENPTFLLEIIGDGEDKSQLKKLANELLLNNNILFLGRKSQEEVLNHYSMVDCVIVNSNFETYSMVTVEAILSGVPVIATKCKGPEQFINDNNGLLIEIGKPNELIDAMLLIKERNLSPTVIVNSLSNRFSMEIIGNTLLDIYQKQI